MWGGVCFRSGDMVAQEGLLGHRNTHAGALSQVVRLNVWHRHILELATQQTAHSLVHFLVSEGVLWEDGCVKSI